MTDEGRRPIFSGMGKVQMTTEELLALAATAEERVAGYVRVSSADPTIQAAKRRRFRAPDPVANDRDTPPPADKGYSPVKLAASV